MEFVLVFCNRLYKEEILFIEKDRPEYQKGRFNLPGGKIEPNEQPLIAGIRELKEETGYCLKSATIAGIITDTIRSFKIHICKGIVDAKGEPKPRAGETEKPFWMVWSQIYKDPKLMPNLRVAIPLLMAGIKDFEIIWDEKTDILSPTFELILKLKNDF